MSQGSCICLHALFFSKRRYLGIEELLKSSFSLNLSVRVSVAVVMIPENKPSCKIVSQCCIVLLKSFCKVALMSARAFFETYTDLDSWLTENKYIQATNPS